MASGQQGRPRPEGPRDRRLAEQRGNHSPSQSQPSIVFGKLLPIRVLLESSSRRASLAHTTAPVRFPSSSLDEGLCKLSAADDFV